MNENPLTTEYHLPPHRPSLELGRIQFHRGHLHHANTLFEQAIAEGNAPGIGMSYLAISQLHYEWNNLDTAAFYIQQGLTHSRQSNNLTTQITGYRLWARLQQVYGNIEGANEAMRQAHDLAETHQLPPRHQLENGEWELLLALNRDDLNSVEHWWQRVSIPKRFHPTRSFIYARTLIALGQFDLVNAYLDNWLPLAVQNRQQYAIVALLIQQALATVNAPHPLIIDALTLAVKERLVRIFIDEGNKLLPLLYAAKGYPATAVYAEELIAAARQAPRMDVSRQIGLPQPKPSETATALQAHEMQLLRLVMDGKNYHDIAEHLSIPYQAVKLQMEALYQKMGVHNEPDED